MALDISIPVLVIDDSATTLKVVSQLLQKCGFTDVHPAPEVLGAFHLMQKHKFGLILCDVEMQPMNGVEFLRAIRSEKRTRDIGFVLMTTMREPNIILEASRLNVDAFLLKPFTVEGLKDKLSKIAKLCLPMVVVDA